MALSPIPKIIHQTWKDENIPNELKQFQLSWKNHHRDWEYKFWTDDDLEEFIKTNYREFYSFYCNYPHQIQRVDAARYFIMYHFGGIYADLDMQCLVPFDTLIQQYTGVVLGEENQMHHDSKMRIGNAIIISEPHAPFWEHVFRELMGRAGESDPESVGSTLVTTGPSMLHEVYRKHSDGVHVMKSNIFYPKPWSLPSKDTPLALASRSDFPRSWSVHHWAGTWRHEPKRCNVNGLSYYISREPRKDGYGIIEKKLRYGQIWRDKILQTFQDVLREGDVVVQVGAYNGYLTMTLAQLVGETGHVHAFEPASKPRELLELGIRENKFRNRVSVYDFALYSHTVTMFLSNKWNPKRPHRRVWKPEPNAVAYCTGVPLDQMDRNDIRRLDLLHVEANTQEYFVLKGAEGLIQAYKPVIVVEILPDQERHDYEIHVKYDDVIRYLQNLRYSVNQVDGSLHVAIPE